jgi:hypothetical protein
MVGLGDAPSRQLGRIVGEIDRRTAPPELLETGRSRYR